MKKRSLLLLAGLALVLTSCGTTYTYASDENVKLSLGGSSFTITEKDEGEEAETLLTKSYEWSSYVAEKGTVEESDEEGEYVLTVTSITQQYVAEGEGAETAYDFYEVALKLQGIWTSEEIDDLLEGKKVTKKLDEDDYYKIKVSVDADEKTYKVVLF